MKKWKCTVCGYIISSEEQPQKCPACGAGPDRIIENVEQEDEMKNAATAGDMQEAQTRQDSAAETKSERQWKCTVCNYIHKGEEPPDICPVCGADKSFFVEVGVEEAAETSQTTAQETVTPKKATTVQSEDKRRSYGIIGKLIMRLNLHPISVHTPNGVIPVAVVFLLLGLLLQYAPLEMASFFNLIFVLFTMPVVIFTGFVAWQKKYRGAKTALFKTKLVCSAVVMIMVSLMVFWRFIDLQIGLSGSIGSWIYVGLGGVALLAAGIAGHLGGKLVFGK